MTALNGIAHEDNWLDSLVAKRWPLGRILGLNNLSIRLTNRGEHLLYVTEHVFEITWFIFTLHLPNWAENVSAERAGTLPVLSMAVPLALRMVLRGREESLKRDRFSAGQYCPTCTWLQIIPCTETEWWLGEVALVLGLGSSVTGHVFMCAWVWLPPPSRSQADLHPTLAH